MRKKVWTGKRIIQVKERRVEEIQFQIGNVPLQVFIDELFQLFLSGKIEWRGQKVSKKSIHELQEEVDRGVGEITEKILLVSSLKVLDQDSILVAPKKEVPSDERIPNWKPNKYLDD